VRGGEKREKDISFGGIQAWRQVRSRCQSEKVLGQGREEIITRRQSPKQWSQVLADSSKTLRPRKIIGTGDHCLGETKTLKGGGKRIAGTRKKGKRGWGTIIGASARRRNFSRRRRKSKRLRKEGRGGQNTTTQLAGSAQRKPLLSFGNGESSAQSDRSGGQDELLMARRTRKPEGSLTFIQGIERNPSSGKKEIDSIVVKGVSEARRNPR